MPGTITVSSHAVSLLLPFAPRSSAMARRLLLEWLAALDQPPSMVEDARLVLSELVGNAVRHARPLPGGVLRVAWDRIAVDGERDGMDISVTDGGGESRPHLVDSDEADPFGRGLSIIAAVSVRWWYEDHDDHGTTHAVLALT